MSLAHTVSKNWIHSVIIGVKAHVDLKKKTGIIMLRNKV